MKPSAVGCPAFFFDDQYCPLHRWTALMHVPRSQGRQLNTDMKCPRNMLLCPHKCWWGFKLLVPEGNQRICAAANRLNLEEDVLSNSFPYKGVDELGYLRGGGRLTEIANYSKSKVILDSFKLTLRLMISGFCVFF